MARDRLNDTENRPLTWEMTVTAIHTGRNRKIHDAWSITAMVVRTTKTLRMSTPMAFMKACRNVTCRASIAVQAK